jgi:hypothetical protein
MTQTAVVDLELEMRLRKQAAANEKLRKHGREAFRIIQSAEAAPITYDQVPDSELPTPASS